MLRDGLSWYVERAKKLGFDFPERVVASCHLCNLIFNNRELLKAIKPQVEEEASRLRLNHLLGRK